MADNYTPYSGAYSGEEIDSILTKASTSETYTSAEKTKLSTLFNYDDTLVKSDISDLKSGKVDKVNGKGLSTNDYTTAEKSKLSGIESGANKTIVDTVLSSSSSNPVTNSAITTAVNSKVDKVSGKGLSTNDYTTDEKDKLAGLNNYDDTEVYAAVGTVANLGSKNILKNTAVTAEINGVTFTVNDNGSVTATGTATANADFTISNLTGYPTSGRYVLSGCPEGGDLNTYRIQIYQVAADYGNDVEFTSQNRLNVYIRINSGQTVDNLTFYPMIRPAEISDRTYQPYAPTNRELYEMILALGSGA